MGYCSRALILYSRKHLVCFVALFNQEVVSRLTRASREGNTPTPPAPTVFVGGGRLRYRPADGPLSRGEAAGEALRLHRQPERAAPLPPRGRGTGMGPGPGRDAPAPRCRKRPPAADVDAARPAEERREGRSGRPAAPAAVGPWGGDAGGDEAGSGR